MGKKSTVLKKHLQIVMVPIDDLRPADYNPRTHDDVQLAHLLESIRRFGMVDPVVVNGSPGRYNVLIGGHFRLLAAKELGMREVPVVYLNIPDITKEKELNLRLNRNTGEWDFEKLRAFEMDVLLDVGFEDADLSGIWADVLQTEDDAFDVEKELEQITEPQTKPGDLYQIGPHRLLCADAADFSQVRRLVGEESMHMFYTDFPYNIHFDYDKGLSQGKRYGGRMQDNKSDADYDTFLRTILQNGLAVSGADLHCFSWCDQSYVGLLQKIYAEIGIDYRRTCLWVKNNANVTPQVAFNKCYEPCVYGVRGSPPLTENVHNLHEILNKEVGSGNRTIDDINDLFDIWLCKRLPGGDYEHPTQKPVTLHEKPLRRCTRVHDCVLDLTAGSGSTLVACEQMKRRAFLMEIEPAFCDVILRRCEALGLSSSLLAA